MAYFNNYYNTLVELKKTINDDIKNFDEEDDRLLSSLVNFAKSVDQLAETAVNNSAIENKFTRIKSVEETTEESNEGVEETTEESNEG